MSNFWDLSDDSVLESTTSFESGGGKIEPIPDGTTAVALIDEAKWDFDKEGNKFVSLRWSILAPSEYKNRKIWQKLWLEDNKPGQKDPEKYRDKQLKMFAAIDANSGGKLRKSAKKPTDEMLGAALENKPMQIKVMTWDDQQTKKPAGNWIAAVAPRGNAQAAKHDSDIGDDDAPF
jgi:hypothetical protein